MVGSPSGLTGFLRCACGGSIGGHIALHGTGPTSERKKVLKYGCNLRRNRGELACGNALTLKTEAIDEAVLMTLRKLIEPDILAEAVAHALTVLMQGQDGYAEKRAALEAEVKDAEAKTARLVAAITAGGQIEALIDGLKQEEARKAALRGKLDAMPAAPPVLNTEAIVTKLKEHASDLVGLLTAEHGPKTRALMRKLIPEPLAATPTETPDGRKGFKLTGRMSFAGLIDAQVAEMLTHATNTPTVVAPTGFATWWASISASLCGIQPSGLSAPLQAPSGHVRRLTCSGRQGSSYSSAS
jgi:Recombinase zinc beta ribbon domain